MMPGGCTNVQRFALTWEASWLGTIQKKPGIVPATVRVSISLEKWSMDRTIRICLRRKRLRRIKRITRLDLRMKWKEPMVYDNPSGKPYIAGARHVDVIAVGASLALLRALS